MPCFVTECTPLYELGRLVVSFALAYACHLVVQMFVGSSFVQFVGQKQPLTKPVFDELTQILRTTLSIGVVLSVYGGLGATWFVGNETWFAPLSRERHEVARWYNTLALCVWLLDTHASTLHRLVVWYALALPVLIVSYALDLTRVSLCLALAHSVFSLTYVLELLTQDRFRAQISSPLWGLVLWEYLSTIFSIYGDECARDIGETTEDGKSFLDCEGRSWQWGSIATIVFLLLHWVFFALTGLGIATDGYTGSAARSVLIVGVAAVLRVLLLPSF